MRKGRKKRFELRVPRRFIGTDEILSKTDIVGDVVHDFLKMEYETEITEAMYIHDAIYGKLKLHRDPYCDNPFNGGWDLYDEKGLLRFTVSERFRDVFTEY